jgi:hypothetical protein
MLPEGKPSGAGLKSLAFRQNRKDEMVKHRRPVSHLPASQSALSAALP